MEEKRRGILKSVVIYAIILAGIFLVIHMLGSPAKKSDPIRLTYNELLDWVESDLKVDRGLSGGNDGRRSIKFRFPQGQGNAVWGLRRQGAVRPDAAALQLEKVSIQRDHW